MIPHTFIIYANKKCTKIFGDQFNYEYLKDNHVVDEWQNLGAQQKVSSKMVKLRYRA